MFVKFELAYGGTIMVNPEHVYLLEENRDGVRIFFTPGDGKRCYTLKTRDLWEVSRKLTGEKHESGG